MKRTNRGGNSFAAVIAVAALLVVAPTNTQAMELSLVETGAEPNTSIGLWARNFNNTGTGVSRLVSPSGDVFTPGAALQNNFVSSLLRNFDSLSDALDYVEGAWQATSLVGFGQLHSPLDFSIGAISPNTISRAAPQPLTPAPGAVIKSNTTFNFAWDYPTNGSAEPDHSLIEFIPQFNPLSSWSRFVVSPLNTGNYVTSTGTAPNSFGVSEALVTGAVDNRYLLTMSAANADLPLNVELTLGSYVSLNDSIPIDAGNPFPFLVPVNFFYSRQIQPFDITVSTVPEPSTISLVVMMFIGTLFRPTRRST